MPAGRLTDRQTDRNRPINMLITILCSSTASRVIRINVVAGEQL